jgi:hypothetical protein
MLVKDDSEVKMLDRCLDSIQNYVDEVFITVTNPDQKEIQTLAKKRGFNLSEFKWCNDFSKARNFNFSQVKKTDWILWLDSDDIFVGGELLRDVAQASLDSGKDVVFFTYWYGCTFKGEPSQENLVTVDLEHLRERLIKPNKTEWKGLLHETPVPISQTVNTYVNYTPELPIAVMHTLTDKQSKEKYIRNKEILEQQLRLEGKDPDPRTLLYLMKIYSESFEEKDRDKILEYGYIYVTKSGWDEERCTAYELMGNVYAQRSNFKQAIEMYLKGIESFPYQPLIYLRLAQAYFNTKRYKECKHWLSIGMGLDISNKTTSMVNYEAMKLLSSELLLKLAFQVDKDTKKAYEAAKLVYSVQPTDEHRASMEYLENVNTLNETCELVDKLCEKLELFGENETIPKLLDILPEGISTQPFAIKARQRNIKPKIWGKKEICYFANFGGPHFEKWDGNSLSKGIGGSETAVISLAEQWVKKGYNVAVYGDPEKPCQINGVVYLPWYWFNHNDKFNIFIQWRGWGLAGKIKCKKFLVDLHDVMSGVDFGEEDLKHIDKIMVKSKFHRDLAPNIPDNKFVIISNGLNETT